jgi:hypothetical protein
MIYICIIHIYIYIICFTYLHIYIIFSIYTINPNYNQPLNSIWCLFCWNISEMSWVHTLLFTKVLPTAWHHPRDHPSGQWYAFLCTFFSWTLQLPKKKTYWKMIKDDVLHHNCGICWSMFISCWHLERVMICSHSYGPKYQLVLRSHPIYRMFLIPLKSPVITNSHGLNCIDNQKFSPTTGAPPPTAWCP